MSKLAERIAKKRGMVVNRRCGNCNKICRIRHSANGEVKYRVCTADVPMWVDTIEESLNLKRFVEEDQDATDCNCWEKEDENA